MAKATEIKKHALYVTRVPLALGVLSIALFIISAVTQGIWSQGWAASLVLALLCLETFALPYALLPLATKLPAVLPWVRYHSRDEFGIDGSGRFRQRAIVGSLLLLPGIATLGAFGDAMAQPALWQKVLTALLLGAQVPAVVFALLVIVLALPDFTKVEV